MQYFCPTCYEAIIFSRDCLRLYITHNDDPVIKCPFDDGQYICGADIPEREIKAVSYTNLHIYGL